MRFVDGMEPIIYHSIQLLFKIFKQWNHISQHFIPLLYPKYLFLFYLDSNDSLNSPASKQKFTQKDIIKIHK